MDRIPANVVTLDDLLVLNRGATIARILIGVAHEVNNALQVIGGTAELLAGIPDLPATVTGRLARIRTQQARAAAAITEVLAFARETPDGRANINMREVVARAVSLRSFAIGRAGLAIRFNAPDDQPLTVHANRMDVKHAVLNLIQNAEQALDGAGSGSISVDAAREDGWVVVRVADNGPGVPEEARDRIFEPFVTTRSRLEASGLGLTVTRAIAERCGGTVRLERASPGACFALRLPALR